MSLIFSIFYLSLYNNFYTMKKSLTHNKRNTPKRIVRKYTPGGLLDKMNTSSAAALKDSFSSGNIASTIGGLGSGIMSIVDASMANGKVDTSKADNAIDAINAYTPNSSSLEGITSGFNALNFNNDINSKDMTVSTGEGLANMGKAGLAGFTIGLQTGGIWGGIAGGLAGLISSGGAWWGASNKAKTEEERLKREEFLAAVSATNKASEAKDTYFENKYNDFMENIAAYGGPLYNHSGDWSNGIIFVNEGRTHEENPLEGVQMGVDNQGIPNLVEEGEVIWNDYVFSNRLKPTDEFKKKYKLRGETFADVAKKAQEESAERPYDEISKRGLDDLMSKLMTEQEIIRVNNNNTNIFSMGGNKNRKCKQNKYAGGSFLRYAPALGSGLSVLGDIAGVTNKPDYSSADLIKESTSNLKNVTYTPTDVRLSETPMDTKFYYNQFRNQLASTNKAIQNAGGIPAATMANLQLANYNGLTQMGNLARQEAEYKAAQKEKIAGFNRESDIYNATGEMKAAAANQANDKLKLQSAIYQAQLRDQADANASAAKSANWSNWFTNLGNIGIDNKNNQMLQMLIDAGVFGTLPQKSTPASIKPVTTTTPVVTGGEAIQTPDYIKGTDPSLYDSAEEDDPYWYTKAKGGKIRRRKIKKGLTY